MLAEFGVNINQIVEGNQGNIRQTVIDFARALDTLEKNKTNDPLRELIDAP
jgi:hypothetical protein